MVDLAKVILLKFLITIFLNDASLSPFHLLRNDILGLYDENTIFFLFNFWDLETPIGSIFE
jgi:hypothetical protein